MHPKNIIKRAREFRSRGYTFTEIKKNLGYIPQSTLSYWCKKIELPSFYHKKIQHINEVSREKAKKVSLIKRENEMNILLKEVEKQNKSAFKIINKNKKIKKIILAILYLGEGAKWKSHRGLMLGSSDPEIINLYTKLLTEVYYIQSDQLRARICYRADQNIKKLTRYWSKITGLSKKQFYRTKPDPRTLGRPTKNKEYKGVCVITCAGTKIQLELETIAKMLYKYM